MLRQQDEQTILVLCSLFANSQNSKDNICGGIRNGATRATSSSRLRGEERIQYRTDFMRQIFFSAVPTQAETAWYSDSKSRRVSSYCTQIEICLASTTLHIQKERRTRRDGISQTLPHQIPPSDMFLAIPMLSLSGCFGCLVYLAYRGLPFPWERRGANGQDNFRCKEVQYSYKKQAACR